MNAVLLAGVGSMLIMRSRLFNMKVGDETMAFGPEQLVKIYFQFMERAIDRVRARDRIKFVRDTLTNVDFNRVFSYTIVMLDSAQVLSDKQKEDIR